MSKLNHDEIYKREALKQAMDSDLFKEAVFDVRRSLADEMLRTNDAAQRERLHMEASLLDRLQGKLTEYTNELLFLEVKKTEEAA